MLQRQSDPGESEQLGFYRFCRDAQEQQTDKQEGIQFFSEMVWRCIFYFQGGLRSIALVAKHAFSSLSSSWTNLVECISGIDNEFFKKNLSYACSRCWKRDWGTNYFLPWKAFFHLQRKGKKARRKPERLLQFEKDELLELSLWKKLNYWNSQAIATGLREVFRHYPNVSG